ncbi:hypothetical protein [Micromonospora sp. CPCC 206061]|uniref:hypothetical protein n=1 Tax=Micromonospora sp. CPCC 206061 TaxID=3122410 RepID=UPI002FF32BA3
MPRTIVNADDLHATLPVDAHVMRGQRLVVQLGRWDLHREATLRHRGGEQSSCSFLGDAVRFGFLGGQRPGDAGGAFGFQAVNLRVYSWSGDSSVSAGRVRCPSVLTPKR